MPDMAARDDEAVPSRLIATCYLDSKMTDRTPLYVRLPTPQAERLREAAHRLNISKQDLVSRLVAGLGEAETLRRVTVETTDDHLTVGHAEFRPYDPPDVMTTQQLAAWLQIGRAHV